MDVSSAYWDHLLEHGEPPASVFKFCKSVGLDEGEFYRQFGSFEAIEGDFWKSTVVDVLQLLEADPEAAQYDSRQRLLAFYFTYFESIVEHRSKFLLRFPCIRTPGGRALQGFHQAFDTFAESLIAQARAEGVVHDLKRLNGLHEKGLYPQFRFLIDFHLKDDSRGFGDTDALIEKSVRFFFDAAKFPVLESSLDLIRFLLPRLRHR